MKEVGRVHVLEALEALVDDVLLVDIFQNVGSDDGVQVGVHEVEHEVDISIVLSSDYVLQPYNVFVTIKFLQENNLSEGTLGISRVLEGVEVLLESDDLLSSFVDCFPDNTVGTLAQLLENFILLKDMSLDFFSHLSI